MSFDVDPAAVRTYARELGDVERVADDASRYVQAYGNFSFHQQGIIGYVAPGHRTLMGNLQQLLTRLRELGVESQRALRAAADQYEHTDAGAAAAVDATYPPVPRARPSRD